MPCLLIVVVTLKANSPFLSLGGKVSSDQDIMGSFFVDLKKELQSKSQTTSFVQHRGSIGELREKVFTEFLRPFIPNSYQITKGKIIDTNRTISSEFDVVISNMNWSPSVFNVEGISPVFIENVAAVIEVKSSVDKAAIEKFDQDLSTLSSMSRKFIYSDVYRMIRGQEYLMCRYFEKMHSMEGLKYMPREEFEKTFTLGALEAGSEFSPVSPIRTILFGYDGISKDSLINHLNEMTNKPDMVIILDCGVFVLDKDRKYMNVLTETQNDYEAAYLALWLSDWIDKSSADRLFVKSKLEFYL